MTINFIRGTDFELKKSLAPNSIKRRKRLDKMMSYPMYIKNQIGKKALSRKSPSIENTKNCPENVNFVIDPERKISIPETTEVEEEKHYDNETKKYKIDDKKISNLNLLEYAYNNNNACNTLEVNCSEMLFINLKHKTELCFYWEKYGFCQFGSDCLFAHGELELRTNINISENYKTKLCKQFTEEHFCQYGERCWFIHSICHSYNTLNYSEILVDSSNLAY